MISITLISDTHNRHRDLPGIGSGDIILHAGDATSRGRGHEIEDFLYWYGNLDFDKKVLVAGNHDFGFEERPEVFADMCGAYGVHYLNDSGVTYRSIKIWGSPVQPTFHDWAFNRSPTAIQPHWDKIPYNADILITHGPAYGILDASQRDERVGCPRLLKRIQEVQPRLHVCGHIHEARGHYTKGHTTYINAASLDRYYEPYPLNPYKVLWQDGEIVLDSSPQPQHLCPSDQAAVC